MFDFLKRKPTARKRISDAKAELLELAVRRQQLRHAGWQERQRYIYGTYDAAQTTIDNEKHWAAADALSADKANSLVVRKTLRTRGRYEVANNPYALGMLLTLANHVVGRCPRFQLRTDNSDLNSEVEAEWNRWAAVIRLGAKLRTMRMARGHDGEGFLKDYTNTKLWTPVKLDVELVECDRVTAATLMDDGSIDGITFDELGNPKTYRILKGHPGGTVSVTDEAEEVDAKHIYHWFRADRPGQHRGVPDIMPALPLFAMLRRYTLAVIDAAEAAADFAAVLYTDAPASGSAEDIEPMDAIELERNTVLTMPGGWKMEQMEARQPATTYPDFKREILNEIARCLNMPFNIAACNSSQYNYASGRLDHQTYFTAIEVDRADLVEVVVDPLTQAWLEEAQKAYPWPANILEAPRSYMWDGWGHVDPMKQSKARDIDLKNYSTTLAASYATEGKDWEAELEQAAREHKKRVELGLPEPGKSPGGGPGDGAEAAAEAVMEELEYALRP